MHAAKQSWQDAKPSLFDLLLLLLSTTILLLYICMSSYYILLHTTIHYGIFSCPPPLPSIAGRTQNGALLLSNTILPLYMCPHTAWYYIYVLKLYICPHTTYYYVYVLILHTTTGPSPTSSTRTLYTPKHTNYKLTKATN